MRSVLSNQRGSAMVLFAIALVCLLGMAALTIDVGFVYSEKAKLQNLVDATALAGARELPTSPDKAETVGAQYAVKNGKAAGDILTLTVLNDDTELSASITRTAPSFFSKLFNITGFPVTVAAKAKVIPIKGHSNVVPLAIVEIKPLQKGVDYILKYNSDFAKGKDDLGSGNYGAMSLDPDQAKNGAHIYEEYFKTGYPYPIKVGDQYFTEPGNMVGPTVNGLNYRIQNNLLDIVVPIVNTLDVNGRKKVTVIGFAAFRLKDVANDKDGTVTGTFINHVTEGEIANDLSFGAYTVKLIE